MHDDHPDHLVVALEPDPPDASRRASHLAHVVLGETDRHSAPRGQEEIVRAIGELYVDQPIVLDDVDRDDPRGPNVGVLGQAGLLHQPVAGREDEELVRAELSYSDDRRDLVVLVDPYQVHDRLAARRPPGERDLEDFEPVAAARDGEDHEIVVGGGEEEVLHPVLLLRAHPGDSPPAATLTAVGVGLNSLDVALVADRDHHVLLGDQILLAEVRLHVDDLGPACIPVLLRQLAELLPDDLHAQRSRLEDPLELRDLDSDLIELLLQLLDLEPGETGQTHVEDRLGLAPGEIEALAQPAAGGLRVARSLDDLDRLVDVVDRDPEPFEHVLAISRGGEVMLGATHDDLVAMIQEVLEHLTERQHLRRAIDEREHDHPEGRLHLRVLEELIQHDPRDRVALELQHDADPVPIGFVPHVRDVDDPPGAHLLRDLLDEPALVDHERDLGDDDLLAAAGTVLDVRPRAHDDPSAARLVGLPDRIPPVDEPSGGKVRSGDLFHQVGDRGVGIVDQPFAGRDDLAQVVRRNVGRHPDRDPGGAVHQQVRNPAGQHVGLFEALVEVRREVDGLLVDVRQHLQREGGQPCLRVAVGRRAVPIDRTEVPLAVHQWVAERELLDHADQRVVYRAVAVRVILAEHVPHDGRALLVRSVRGQPGLVHRVEDAPVHGLQAVLHVGQRSLDDDAHRVVDERLSHLVLE